MAHGDLYNVLWPNESGVHCWCSGSSRVAGFVCEASVLQSDWQKANEKGLFIHLRCINAQHAMPERFQIKSFYQRTSNLVMLSMWGITDVPLLKLSIHSRFLFQPFSSLYSSSFALLTDNFYCCQITCAPTGISNYTPVYYLLARGNMIQNHLFHSVRLHVQSCVCKRTFSSLVIMELSTLFW